MLTNRVGLMFLLTLSVSAAGAHAQSSSESLAITPNEIVWKTPAVGLGLETAVTYGDPTKSGPYVLRVKFPAGLCPPSALMRQIGWVEEGRISGSS